MGNRLTARAVMKFTQEIGRGGEGVVYETDRRDGQVCKVLDQSRRPRSTIEKLKLMIERQVEHPAICWPTELVRDWRRNRRLLDAKSLWKRTAADHLHSTSLRESAF